MLHDAQTKLLRLFRFSMVLADKRLETFGQTNEANGQRPMLKHFAHLILGGELFGINPDALPHQEGVVLAFLVALNFQPFEKLLENQIDHLVQLEKEGRHVSLCQNAEPGKVDRGEAQVAAPVDDLAGRIMHVGHDPSAASHVGDFRFRTARMVVGEIERSVDKGKIREQPLGRNPAGELEQIIVGVALLEVHPVLHLEDVNREDGGFPIAQSGFSRQQDVADHHPAFRRRVGAVIDGTERDLGAGTAMHGVQIVDQRLHGLKGILFRELQRLVDDALHPLGRDHLPQLLAHEGESFGVENGFAALEILPKLPPDLITAFHIANVQNQIHLAYERLGHAESETVLEIRNALSAMLIVLVGLDGDARQGTVALNAVRFTQKAVSRIETALEELLDVNLTAGGGQAQEIKIMDMDIPVLVGKAVLRIQQIHFVKLLGCLAPVLEHGTHGRIAVDIGIFALEIVVASILERQIPHGGHKASVHLPHAGALMPIQNIRLGRPGMSGLDQGFFHHILNLLDPGNRITVQLVKPVLHHAGNLLRHGVVVPPLRAGRLEYRLRNLAYVKGNNPGITLLDGCNHNSLRTVKETEKGKQKYPFSIL